VADPSEHATTTRETTRTSRAGAYSRWSSRSSGLADLLRRARAESRLIHERAVRARRAKVRRRPSPHLGVRAPSHKRRESSRAFTLAAALVALATLVSFGLFSPFSDAGGRHRADTGGTPRRNSSPASVGTARPNSPVAADVAEAPPLPPPDSAPMPDPSVSTQVPPPRSASVTTAPAAPPAPSPPPPSPPLEPTASPPSPPAPEPAPPEPPAPEPPAPEPPAPEPPAPEPPVPEIPVPPDLLSPELSAVPDLSAPTDLLAPPGV
jgi:hypothetical protein